MQLEEPDSSNNNSNVNVSQALLLAIVESPTDESLSRTGLVLNEGATEYGSRREILASDQLCLPYKKCFIIMYMVCRAVSLGWMGREQKENVLFRKDCW